MGSYLPYSAPKPDTFSLYGLSSLKTTRHLFTIKWLSLLKKNSLFQDLGKATLQHLSY